VCGVRGADSGLKSSALILKTATYKYNFSIIHFLPEYFTRVYRHSMW
jgi:hypothetical protein